MVLNIPHFRGFIFQETNNSVVVPNIIISNIDKGALHGL